MPQLVTVDQAARVVGKSTDAVRKLVQRHAVPVHSPNGYNVRVKLEDVTRVVEEINRRAR